MCPSQNNFLDPPLALEDDSVPDWVQQAAMMVRDTACM